VATRIPRPRPEPIDAPAPRRYFIVNPAGCIHEVDREHARWRLGFTGWRMASKAELDELTARKGEQRCDSPICEPWSPDPDAQIDPDA
jgi:hypothetical protein